MKKFILTAVALVSAAALTACGNTLDVIGSQSVKSFEAVVASLGDKVTEDTEFGGYSLLAPDGTARFLWSSDYSKTNSNDVQLVIDAQPFIDAGLDTAKLPEGMLAGDKLILGTELGDDALTYSDEVTPTAAYEQIVDNYRDSIKYHAALDHYGVALSGGNMFEWAKDMASNDKDIVFVLNPEVFLEAGVDPDKVEGWVFAKVETMDDMGKEIEVDKLLKPFDLDGKPAK